MLLRRSCLLLLALTFSAQAEPAPLRLTIFHTNDLHSHNEPYREKGRNLGGMARITTLLKQMRPLSTNAIALDAGDIFQGSPYYQLYHGEVEVELLNLAGYDIGTIGNHEFDDGPVNLARQLKRARYQVVNCNLDTSAYPELSACYVPSAVREFQGQKVAFVGAVTPDLEQIANHLENIRLKRQDGDWLAPLRQEVARLQSLGIDKIVLLTHCGVDCDREIAAGVPGVDVIVGGHSHTRLERPVEVSGADGNRTLIVQADCYARCVGKFEVAFDAQGRVVPGQCHYQLLDVTDQIAEDPVVKAYLEEKGKPLAASREPLQSVATHHFEDRFEQLLWDSPLGNLVTSAYAEFARPHGVTIALHNRGGLRSRMEAGPLVRGQIEAVLPFDNKLILAEVPGSTLKSVLEHSLAGDRGGRFFDVHGLQIGYKPAAPAGRKLVFLRVLDAAGQWVPFDARRTYKVAVNDYSFGGGEGYRFEGSKVLLNTGRRLSEFLVDYARRHPRLVPSQPSRIAPLQLRPQRRGDRVQLPGLPAGTEVRFFTGPALGITSWEGIPLPLSQPRPLRAVASPDGWRLAAHSGWVAVVARSAEDVQLGLLPP